MTVTAYAQTGLLDIIDTGGGLLFAAGEAACCCGNCECPCDYLTNKWANVQSLSAHIDYPAGCAADVDEDVTLAHSGGSQLGINCAQWGTTRLTSFYGDLEITVWCDDTNLYAQIVATTASTARCHIAQEGVPVAPVSLTCDADSLEAIFEFTVVDNPDEVLLGCDCVGETLRITVT